MMNQDEIRSILDDIKFNDWKFFLGMEEDRMYLQIKVDGKDNLTGEPVKWSGRKWFISPYMVKSEIVGTAWMAVQTCMMHEMRESFTYKGKMTYNPHINVDHLVEIMSRPDATEERPNSINGV